MERDLLDSAAGCYSASVVAKVPTDGKHAGLWQADACNNSGIGLGREWKGCG